MTAKLKVATSQDVAQLSAAVANRLGMLIDGLARAGAIDAQAYLKGTKAAHDKIPNPHGITAEFFRSLAFVIEGNEAAKNK